MAFTGSRADVRAIKDLMFKYALYLDLGPESALQRLFTPEAVLDSPLGVNPGRTIARPSEGIESFASRRAKRHAEPDHITRHFITNFWIDGGPDAARVSAYLIEVGTWFAARPPETGPVTAFLFTGDYECSVVKAGDEWYIARRTVRMDSRPHAYRLGDVPYRFVREIARA